jgi:hypothetical protein
MANAQQQQELQRLREIKRASCFCPACGKQLQFGSFRKHPCFTEAVQRHGRVLARRLMPRLSAPPAQYERQRSLPCVTWRLTAPR